MTPKFSTNNIGAILRFPFEDPDATRKLLIAGLIALAGFIIPLLPWIVLAGYTAEIVRRVVRDGASELPEWNDWGRLLEDGLKVTAAYFIFLLPLIIPVLLSTGSVFFFPAAEEAARAGSDGAAALLMVVGFSMFLVTILISMVLSILISLAAPAGLTHLVMKDDFGAAFRVREWWPIFKANLTGFIWAFLVVLGISMAIGLLSQILVITIVLICLLPVLYAAMYAYVMPVWGALIGAAYREGSEELAVTPQPAEDAAPAGVDEA